MVLAARLRVFCFVLGLATLPPSFGQPAPRLPQDAAPAPQPAAPELGLLIDRERFAEQVPAGAQAVTLRLTGIDLSGNTRLPTSQFEPLWAGLLGRDITLATVFDLAARISAAYREAGYVLSQALVPQQDINPAGGRVRIRVAEGFVSLITVQDSVPGAQRIRRMLDPVRSERPLTLATLERCLLLVGDLPGLRTQALLRAGRAANAAELELVVERDTQAFSLALHNRTAASVGPLRLEASAEQRGLLGDFDRHALRWVGAGNDRLNLIAYQGDAPLGVAGASLVWSASASRSRPRAGALFQFDARSRNASLGLGYPVVRSRQANLSLRTALTAYNGASEIADGLPVSKEQIRAVRLGLNADFSDALAGINLLEIELARGLSGLGASRPGDALLARAGSDPQFTKATLYAARLQSLGGEWALLAALTTQHAAVPLTSSEQFGLGGDAFLRAYDPSELLGDSGAAAKIELRYNTVVNTFVGGVGATVYGFYDAGSVTLLGAAGTASSRQSAAAAGLGLRWSGSHGLRGYLELAKPINRATSRHGDERTRAFAGVGIDF